MMSPGGWTEEQLYEVCAPAGVNRKSDGWEEFVRMFDRWNAERPVPSPEQVLERWKGYGNGFDRGFIDGVNCVYQRACWSMRSSMEER